MFDQRCLNGNLNKKVKDKTLEEKEKIKRKEEDCPPYFVKRRRLSNFLYIYIQVVLIYILDLL